MLLTLPGLMSAGCKDSELSTPDVPPLEVLSPESYRELRDYFSSLDYRWGNLAEGVPPFILSKLPEDLDDLDHPREKKRLFFLSLLPMALLVNEEILSDRQTLEAIIGKLDEGQAISEEEQTFLADLTTEYRLSDTPLESVRARKELLTRVDVVPPSLVLAQAANESGYGTSRFALSANNLFGEWTFTPGTGLVPTERPAEARYEVRLFPSVFDSLKSYIRNLNTHWAYRNFRKERSRMRETGQPLTGLGLVSNLELYSSRRQDYVEEIRDIIQYNRLFSLTDITLRTSAPYERYRRPETVRNQAHAQ